MSLTYGDNAANVASYSIGGAVVGATGATPPAPVDSITAWAAGWLNCGLIEVKGIVEAHADSSNEIMAFYNNLVVRRVMTKSDFTIQLTFLETKKTTLELYYKNSKVTTVGAVSQLAVKQPSSDLRAFGFDLLDGTTHGQRIYLPNAEVTSRANITYDASGAAMYDVTITAYPDINLVTAYKFSADTAWTES